MQTLRAQRYATSSGRIASRSKTTIYGSVWAAAWAHFIFLILPLGIHNMYIPSPLYAPGTYYVSIMEGHPKSTMYLISMLELSF